jgi:hypothetical protein
MLPGPSGLLPFKKINSIGLVVSRFTFVLDQLAAFMRDYKFNNTIIHILA